jgi:DNA-binding Xre family transcriptional regulator
MANQRKQLTKRQLQLTSTELMQELGCSKATAWRAKQNGYYCPGYNGSAAVRQRQRLAKAQVRALKKLPASGKQVKLTLMERQLSRNELSRRYGVSHDLASQALSDGEFRIP